MGTRTALFSRQQPGGVFDISDLEKHPADVWFVHSGTGTDGAGYGQNPDAPCATLDYAVGLATASKGDVIYLLPGHAETISTVALSPTLDKIGVKVVGLGAGTLRPTFTFTHADASLIVSAVSCAVSNVLLQVGVDSQVIVVDVNADDFALENSEIREGSALQFLSGIDINGGGANAADRCVIRNCKIVSEAAGATQAIEIGAVEDGVVLDGNWISGDYSVAGIHSGSILTNLLLKDNVLRNVNAADWAVELTGAATGLAVGNRFHSDAAATCFDPGSLMCLDNLMVNAINQSSIPVPTTATGILPTGAIGAASFAAGAIDAAAIANAAIDAATFAAGAIDAAAIAADAIDASALAADAVAEIADGVADEVLSGHLTAGTVGAVLQPLDSGIVQAGAAGTVTLAATASATNNLYNGAVIEIISGTGVGQIRLITAYDGGTKVATVVPNWATNPAAAAVYVVQPHGSVRVDALTAGVIAAASFAAGALDAAAIANDAIDAATFAADAITNAKIADDALATEQFALSAGEKTTDGIIVTRATAALPQTTAVALFTVTGHCLLKRILGVVTVEIGAVGNVTHLRLNSTGAGATTDICLAAGGLNITGDVVDTMYEIDGTFGNAMIATTNLPKAKSQAVDIVLPPGSLELACAGSDGGGGRVRWSATYVPMEAGAQMVAA